MKLLEGIFLIVFFDNVHCAASCVYANIQIFKSLVDDVVSFRVVWKKHTYSITFPLDQGVSKLKEHIHILTGMYTVKDIIMKSHHGCSIILRVVTKLFIVKHMDQ